MFLLEENEENVENHIYYDENKGKYYIFNGEKLVPLKLKGKKGKGGGDDDFDDIRPLGEVPDEDDPSFKEEDEERARQIEKEREESGEDEETEEEYQERLSRIKDMLQDDVFGYSVIDSSEQKVKQEKQEKIRAQKEKEMKDMYGGKNVKSIQYIVNDVKRFIAKQVGKMQRENSWSKYNKRNSYSGYILPGKQRKPIGKVPVINFYFDRSTSWNEEHLRMGEAIVASIYDFQQKGLLKINVKYFGNELSPTPDPYRTGGGTAAFTKIMEDIIAEQPTNVIIMTDNDFDKELWQNYRYKGPQVVLEGSVWLLFKNGLQSKLLIEKIRGRQGTRIINFAVNATPDTD